MTYQAKITNIIVRLKEVKENNPEITLQKISDHTGVSMSTVTRIFAEGSETTAFRYDSVRPIAQMLLGIDNLDEGDDDEKALKAIIQYKDTRIMELEAQLEEEREKHSRKLDKERAQFKGSLEFLKHQIVLKDDRIDKLMNHLETRGIQYEELHKQYMEAMDQLINKLQKNE